MSKETPSSGLNQSSSEQTPDVLHNEMEVFGFKRLVDSQLFQRDNVILHISDQGIEGLFFKKNKPTTNDPKEALRSLTQERFQKLLFAPGTKLVGCETVDEPLFEDDPNGTKMSYHYFKMNNAICSFTLKCDAKQEYATGSVVDFDFHGPICDDFFPLDPKQDIPTSVATHAGEMNVGLPNDDQLIRNIERINGKSIRSLERRMAPDPHLFPVSRYLGQKESLLHVLEQDNILVRSQGLTHQEIARRLFTLMELSSLLGYPLGAGAEFEFEQNGHKYHLGAQFFRGYAESPFEDGTKGSFDVTITNVDTGASIKFGSLLPHMIHRYGFYEGHGPGVYRLDPQEVIDCLDLKPVRKG